MRERLAGKLDRNESAAAGNKDTLLLLQFIGGGLFFFFSSLSRGYFTRSIIISRWGIFFSSRGHRLFSLSQRRSYLFIASYFYRLGASKKKISMANEEAKINHSK